ncbi:toxin biosynthesis protein [Annulohypoxylon moriforme]|nr:toxin biosynthesis protein [Annulohypoxylon moriforme]
MNRGSPNTALSDPDSSIIPHILLWVIQLVALSAPPFRGRRAGFSVLIAVLAVYCNLNPHFTNDFGLAQPFSLAWSFYMNTLAMLLFSGPQGPEGRYSRIDKPKGEALSYPGFGWNKIQWAAVLMFNQRGIRWSHEVKNVRKSPKTERSRFLGTQFIRFVGYLCAADLLYEIHRRVNFTSLDGLVGNMDSKYLTVQHPDIVWRFAKTFSIGALPFFMLSMQYAQGAFFAVLFGLSQPEDWPPAFGSFQDMSTVRSFWGSFWHQQLRHMLTSYTDAFANFLGIPRGCNLSSYTKLYLAFLISGSFHTLGQLHLPRPSNITAEDCALGFLLFFLWQAAAITLEDFVIYVRDRVAGKPSSPGTQQLYTLLGYTWVFMSMWWSLPFVGNAVLRIRVGTESFAPFPLMRPIVEAYVPIPPGTP